MKENDTNRAVQLINYFQEFPFSVAFRSLVIILHCSQYNWENDHFWWSKQHLRYNASEKDLTLLIGVKHFVTVGVEMERIIG